MDAIRGEVAIVTGASSGIGAATATALADRGASVVLAARRAELLRDKVDAIVAAGGRAHAVETDVADPEQVARLADAAITRFGRIDVVVNNAGVNWRTSLVSTLPADVERLIATNLTGAMLLTRAALPGMLERRHGAIVCVGSLSGRVAMDPLYSASKYGLRGFSLALRRQLTGSGVSASLVSPGNIRTPMTDHVGGQLPDPGIVASAICALVDRPRREVVVPRQHYAIAWLEELGPGLADLLYRWRRWSPVE